MDAYSRNPPVKEAGTVEHDMPKSKPTRGSMSSQAAVMTRIVGRRYTSGTKGRLRMRWIRVNGFLLLLFSALIFLNLSVRP